MAIKIKMSSGWAKKSDLAPGDYQDIDEPSLHLYVTATARTWGFYRWSTERRKPERKSIGYLHDYSYEAAKNKAAIIKAEQINVGHLQTKKETPRDEITLGAVVKLYTQKLRGEGARQPMYLEDAITFSFGSWLKRPFTSITKNELFDAHQKIAADPERGPMAAAKAIYCMRSLYSYAIDAGKYKGVNFADSIRVKKPTLRRRVILPAEFKKIMEELDNPRHDPWIRAYFRLLMLTGARRDNVAAMAWEDVDIDTATWHVPADVAKAGEPITIPLLPEAIEILQGRRGLSKEWVFPSPKASSGHLVEPWWAWRRVCSAAGVKEDITIHDIRRTFGSNLAAQGVPLSVIAEAMGHRNPSTTAKHYIVNPAGAVRDALTRVMG